VWREFKDEAEAELADFFDAMKGKNGET